jgi:hypothetical protein
VSNLAMIGYGTFDSDERVPLGRHAFNEDAVLTPIFHALTRGGVRSQRHELRSAPDPVEDFRRNPLTAPIPVQALAPVPASSQPGRRTPAELNPAGSGRRRAAGRGRHHRRLEVVGY